MTFHNEWMFTARPPLELRLIRVRLCADSLLAGSAAACRDTRTRTQVCRSLNGGAWYRRDQSSGRTSMVKMTNRYRQRVGGIVGFGNGGQREQRLDHLLNLKLFGVAVTYHGLFHKSG